MKPNQRTSLAAIMALLAATWLAATLPAQLAPSTAATMGAAVVITQPATELKYHSGVQVITTAAAGPNPWKAYSEWVNDPVKHLDAVLIKVKQLQALDHWVTVQMEPRTRCRMDGQATAGVDWSPKQIAAVKAFKQNLKALSSQHELEFYSTITKPAEGDALWNNDVPGGYCFVSPHSVLGDHLKSLFDQVKPDRFIIDEGTARKSPLTGLDNALLFMRWMEWLKAQGIEVGVEALACVRVQGTRVSDGAKAQVLVPDLTPIGDGMVICDLNQHVIHFTAKNWMNKAAEFGRAAEWEAFRDRDETVAIWLMAPIGPATINDMHLLRDRLGDKAYVTVRAGLSMADLAMINGPHHN